MKDIAKINAKTRASDQLKNAADAWASGKITSAVRDEQRASAKTAIANAKKPHRKFDGDKTPRGLL